MNDIKGFVFPSFLLGVWIGIGAMHFIDTAYASSTKDAAIFRACATQERKLGNLAEEELFRAAAREIGGKDLLPRGFVVPGSICLAMRENARMYVPADKQVTSK